MARKLIISWVLTNLKVAASVQAVCCLIRFFVANPSYKSWVIFKLRSLRVRRNASTKDALVDVLSEDSRPPDSARSTVGK